MHTWAQERCHKGKAGGPVISQQGEREEGRGKASLWSEGCSSWGESTHLQDSYTH